MAGGPSSGLSILFTSIVGFLCPIIVSMASASAATCETLFAVLPEISVRVPIVRQTTDYTCGPASASSVLKYWTGSTPGEAMLAEVMKTDAQFGTSPQAMVRGLRYFGQKAEMIEGLELQHLERLLREGDIVILNIQSEGEGHWVVLSGMDSSFVYLMDPWEKGGYTKISRPEFLKRWYDTHNGRHYLRMGLKVFSEQGPPSLR